MRVTLELEVDLDEVEELFKKHKWLYATPDCYGLPDARAIGAQITQLAARVHNDDGLVMVAGGRLAVARDGLSNDPNSYEVLLSIGYLTVNEEEECIGA